MEKGRVLELACLQVFQERKSERREELEEMQEVFTKMIGVIEEQELRAVDRELRILNQISSQIYEYRKKTTIF